MKERDNKWKLQNKPVRVCQLANRNLQIRYRKNLTKSSYISVSPCHTHLSTVRLSTISAIHSPPQSENMKWKNSEINSTIESLLCPHCIHYAIISHLIVFPAVRSTVHCGREGERDHIHECYCNVWS
jgi:hypothetical protein